MREHYDFSKMKGEKNPYTKQLKQPVTMRLDKATVTYFKSLAAEMGIGSDPNLPAWKIGPFLTLFFCVESGDYENSF